MSKGLARVVVLISGSGSNLQAIIDQQESGQLPIKIVAVISNKDNVKGLERAQNHGISTIVVDHTDYSSREAFDSRLLDIIDIQAPDILVLAGFMRILTPEFTKHYEGKMLNIHPSLLPKYPGLQTHRRALEAGDKVHGVTVHFVTADLDSGPAIIQAQVPIDSEDDESTLAAKVLKEEHYIYPIAISWLASSRLRMEGNESWLDNEKLPTTGKVINRFE